MLRVTEVLREDGSRALRLEGRIVAAWAAMLEERCRELLADHQPLRLDLAAVDYVDRGGLAALRRLQAAEVQLDACPPLVRELLTAEGDR